MVGVPAAVVAHRRTDVLGDGIEVGDQLLDRLALQLGILLERGIEIVHIRLMMLAVMDLHRLLVDERLERVVGVGKRRKFVGHK